ncbi:TPA: hypothetical protein DCZ39_06965 [Patescibacteria group bacterium]|nr:hypothetical protein [Candidatus Gracilibacteria bacterium]
MNMRFQNDATGGARSSRQTYSVTNPRALTAIAGMRTVYAQFDTDGNTGTAEITTSDTINYTLPAPSFTINNYAASTILTGVTLNISGSFMNARFQNESGVR